MAFTSIKAGDLTRADEIANKWLKQYPTKAGGYNLKATIAFVQNKLEQGQAALEQSLKLEPDNIYAAVPKLKLQYDAKPSQVIKMPLF